MVAISTPPNFGRGKKITLCKVIKIKPKQPSFHFVNCEQCQDPEDFTRISELFTVGYSHGKVIRKGIFQVFNGENWSNRGQEAKGYSRLQVHNFFKEGKEKSFLISKIGARDYGALERAWKSTKWHGKVFLRNEEGQIVPLTKDGYFGTSHPRSLSMRSEVWDIDPTKITSISIQEKKLKEPIEAADTPSKKGDHPIYYSFSLPIIIVLSGSGIYLSVKPSKSNACEQESKGPQCLKERAPL